MDITRLFSALASAALLFGTAQHSGAVAQTYPSTAPATPAAAPTTPATTSPLTTPTKAPADVMTPAAVLGKPALDLRDVRAQRTAHGYVLTGQALVNDPCQAARFDPSLLTIYPPQYNLDQFRSPSKMGMMCIQRLTWVTAQPRMVTSAKPPKYITVRSEKMIVRVPIR